MLRTAMTRSSGAVPPWIGYYMRLLKRARRGLSHERNSSWRSGTHVHGRVWASHGNTRTQDLRSIVSMLRAVKQRTFTRPTFVYAMWTLERHYAQFPMLTRAITR